MLTINLNNVRSRIIMEGIRKTYKRLLNGIVDSL